MNQTVEKPNHPHRLIVGISGASGAILGIRLLEMLQARDDIETHLVISPAAEETIHAETGWGIEAVNALADHVYEHKNIGASIASGSFATLGMAVVPCSIKSLSEIANSYNRNLIARAADVTLKEGRPLILAVRETPLHRGHIRLMGLAAEAGAIIQPPMPAFYARPRSVEELVDNFVGRVLARLGVPNEQFTVWRGLDE
jgi:4-hydroxy-3-polyprenylbenzoate decarboxylase